MESYFKLILWRTQRQRKTRTLTELKAFCIDAHQSNGQRYGNDKGDNPLCNGHPFSYHLTMLETIADIFSISDETIRASIFGHDVLEDTRVTRWKLRMYGFHTSSVAIIVACTDGKFGNAARRKKVAYRKILATVNADIVKLIDRSGNLIHSLECSDTKRIQLYRMAHPAFREACLKGDNPLSVRLWRFVDWLTTPEAERMLSDQHQCREKWQPTAELLQVMQEFATS